MSQVYLSPSERYYRGEISREEARQFVLQNAERARKISDSPELNTLLRFVSLMLVPFLAIASILGSRRD